MRSLKKAKNLEGKVFLVRAGFDVPILENGEVENDFRIKSHFQTLDFLIRQKAKIVLVSHLGRDPKNTFEPVFKYLKNKYKNIHFNKNTFRNFNEQKVAEIKNEISDLQKGEILLLDNLRQNEGERANDGKFRRSLASLGDIFVMEAFSNSHRKHASMTLDFDFMGLHYEKEIENLKKILKPESPSIFILGGSKMKTKIPLLEKALKKYDQVIVGGAIANTFYQHLGIDVGDSLVEEVDSKILDKILEYDNFILPDLVIEEDKKILDISPNFFKKMKKDFKKAKFIFLNGPVGYYEGGFTEGTEELLKLCASPNNFFLAGGGNTTSLIYKLNLQKNVDFISTGGGALISFLTK